MCDITWSNNQLGDIPTANIFYSVIVTDVSTNVNKIQHVTQDTKYSAKGLMPYTSYVVKLKTQVKKSGGVLIWESKEETRQFKTTTIGEFNKNRVSNSQKQLMPQFKGIGDCRKRNFPQPVIQNKIRKIFSETFRAKC